MWPTFRIMGPLHISRTVEARNMYLCDKTRPSWRLLKFSQSASINQSIHQSIDRSINQSINLSIYLSIDHQSIDRSISQYTVAYLACALCRSRLHTGCNRVYWSYSQMMLYSSETVSDRTTCSETVWYHGCRN